MRFVRTEPMTAAPASWTGSRRSVLIGGLSLASVGLGGVGLVGCASNTPIQQVPEIRFQDEEPLRIAVDVVDIMDETAPEASSPEARGAFPTPPHKAMRNWGEDRLEAEPLGSGVARYRITQASVARELGDRPSGTDRLFGAEQRQTFTVRVAAELEVRRNDGGLVNAVSANSWGQESFAADADRFDLQRATDAFMRRVMADFDREMEAAIRANIANLLA